MRMRETCGRTGFGALVASCVLIGVGYLRARAAEPAASGAADDVPPPRTSMSDSSVRYSVPEKGYVVLRRGPVEIVVVDNRAVDDAVLPGHRAGYHGVAWLKHAKQPRNLFVPAYAGLNFEHIHDGTAQPREVLFEPRNAPMELRSVNEHAAELYQPPTPHWGLESCLRYALLEDGVIEMTYECIPRRDCFKHGYIGLFWASYIDHPESLDVHFMGWPAGADGSPGWIRGVTPRHGELATHRAVGDSREFRHDADFPLTLVFHDSPCRYSEPWYFGLCRGMAYVQMFRNSDAIRLSQSPSGGGPGCPAWDFQWFIPNYRIGRRYQMVMRAAYLDMGGADEAAARDRVRTAVGPIRRGLPEGRGEDPQEVVSHPRRLIAPHFQPPPELAGKLGDYRSLLHFEDGTPVRSAADWPRRRAELVQIWNQALGPWPAVLDNPRLDVLREEQREGLTWRRVRLEIAPQQTGEGWLLLPPGRGPFPAVLVVYYEPETSVGLGGKGKEYRDFARQLSRRGFVTLSIGTPGGDARRPQVGGAVCQPLSFHAYVAANCWQALARLPEVDRQRIGVTGHSYGGKWALFAAALWERFAAVAVSDPGIVFDEKRGNVNYWEPWYLGLDPQGPQRKPGIPTATNPRTGPYKWLRENNRDLHELHALIAPRPFLVSGGSEDPPERWIALNHTIAVNALLGYSHRVAMTNRAQHAPDAQSTAQLVAFFEHFLKPAP